MRKKKTRRATITMQRNKFRQFLSKFPLFDLLTAIFALLLMIAPISVITLVIRTIGITAALYAILRLVFNFTLNVRGVLFTLYSVSYVMLLVFGAILLINPKGALAFLSVSVGLYLIVDGVIRLLRASRASGAAMVVGMTLAALTVLFGSVLLFYPAGAVKISAILVGAALLTSSITNITVLYIPQRRHFNSKQNYIETDFIDKSDEL